MTLDDAHGSPWTEEVRPLLAMLEKAVPVVGPLLDAEVRLRVGEGRMTDR